MKRWPADRQLDAADVAMRVRGQAVGADRAHIGDQREAGRMEPEIARGGQAKRAVRFGNRLARDLRVGCEQLAGGIGHRQPGIVELRRPAIGMGHRAAAEAIAASLSSASRRAERPAPRGFDQVGGHLAVIDGERS